MARRRDVELRWPRASASPPKLAENALSPAISASDRVVVVRGDNALAMHALARAGVPRAALVYLDPPFFTNREHEIASGIRSGARASARAFDDRWRDLAAYLEWMEARMMAAKAVVAPFGSVVVHVDPKTSHYVKVLGDGVFGMDCFASEIVWRYRRWPAKTANFQRVHDVLLRWTGGGEPRFHQLYEPLAPSTRKTWGRGKQRAVFEGARRKRSSTTAEPSPGAPMGDVWDISILAPIARERTGYPTQKPEALLERLVRALSSEDDVVVDATMGSGTTLAVAARLGRRAIGIDVSHVAHAVTRERLEKAGVSYVSTEVVDQALALA